MRFQSIDLKFILGLRSPSFLDFSWQIIQVDNSSSLAGPAEDVVVKMARLNRGAQSLYTLFHDRKRSPKRRCCCKKGFEKAWEKVQRQEVSRECEPAKE